MAGTSPWAEYADFDEMRREAIERDPQEHRFGVLAGSSCAFDWLHYWFDDERDFQAFEARALELGEGSIGDIAWTGTLDELAKGDSEEALERRRAFWRQQAENDEELDDDDEDDDEEGDEEDDEAEDDDGEALEEDGYEDTDEAEDDDPADPIPAELMDDFVASLYPDWWTGS